jgi:hypothetical protein
MSSHIVLPRTEARHLAERLLEKIGAFRKAMVHNHINSIMNRRNSRPWRRWFNIKALTFNQVLAQEEGGKFAQRWALESYRLAYYQAEGLAHKVLKATSYSEEIKITLDDLQKLTSLPPEIPEDP